MLDVGEACGACVMGRLRVGVTREMSSGSSWSWGNPLVVCKWKWKWKWKFGVVALKKDRFYRWQDQIEVFL
jgi:hypothetical protein